MGPARRDAYSVLLGKRQRVLSVGKGVAEALGSSRKALLGGSDSFTKRIHADDRRKLERILLKSGSLPQGNVELRLRAANGGMRRLRWRYGWDTTTEETRLVLTLKSQPGAKKTGIPHSEELLELFIEHAPAAIAMFDREMRYLAASRRWIADFRLGDRPLAGASHYEVFPEVPERWKLAHQRGMAGEAMRMEEDRFERGDGTHQWLRWEMIPWHAEDGKVGGIVLITEDITERRKNEEKLHRAASVFTHASEGIFITDAGGTILEVNAAFSRITGYSRDEIVGRNPRVLNSGRQGREFYEDLWENLLTKGHWSGEIWNRAKSGQVFAEMLTISAVPDENGKAKQYVALFSDVTSQKEQELQLQRVAHYDLLTGLPNRVLLADRLRQAMAQAHRSGRQIAIACMDLDNFRAVNERYGHNSGDELLTSLTQGIQRVLREGDTLARLGGDELVAVLLDLKDMEESDGLVQQILRAAELPVQIGEHLIQVSASIGLTFYPQAEDIDADQLLRQGDQAMYHAKLAGKGRYHVFDPARDRSERGHHADLQQLHDAMAAGEFVLLYQPKVNMRTGAVQGVEALVRWNHPEKGMMAPAHFLPVLEGTPMAIELGEWVLFQALRQVEIWQKEGLDIPVSVNIEAHHLQQVDFVERLKMILAEFPTVAPSRLQLEVLESSAFEDVAQASQVMRACNRMGVQFALDDFGTGYSSLSYLKRLPVQVLKIDRSFVRDMLDDPEDLTILEGVFGLAKAFRHQAVAEGVETREHGLLLLRMGWQVGQGFAIAAAMPGDALGAWIASWRPDPGWETARVMSPADYPMVYAAVEHRAWVVEVEEYLRDRRYSAPQMDFHLCRFGAWLDSPGADIAKRPGLRAIVAQHERVHRYVQELFHKKAKEGMEAALAGLGRLYKMRDTLVENLQAMADSA